MSILGRREQREAGGRTSSRTALSDSDTPMKSFQSLRFVFLAIERKLQETKLETIMGRGGFVACLMLVQLERRSRLSTLLHGRSK